MSNTVKIKNKKKKKELKINYKLWAIVFAIFVAIIVGLAVWASFHWGVGMGTIGVEPVDPQEASVSATDAASEFSTEDVITLTPEQLQQLQQQQAALSRMLFQTASKKLPELRRLKVKRKLKAKRRLTASKPRNGSGYRFLILC